MCFHRLCAKTKSVRKWYLPRTHQLKQLKPLVQKMTKTYSKEIKSKTINTFNREDKKIKNQQN